LHNCKTLYFMEQKLEGLVSSPSKLSSIFILSISLSLEGGAYPITFWRLP
jgi:hypothetical protein